MFYLNEIREIHSLANTFDFAGDLPETQICLNSFERSSSCSGVIIPMSPHQRKALDSSFALIGAYQQCILGGRGDLNPGHLTCEASVLPLLHQRTLDASKFPRLNRRTCSRLGDVIGVPDSSDDDPVSFACAPPSKDQVVLETHPATSPPDTSMVMAQWLEGDFTDWKVRGSNPTSGSRLPLSRLGQPDSNPALVLLSDGMATRHRKGVTAGQLLFLFNVFHMKFRSRYEVRGRK
ncbi:hypothetical protein CSKR_112666 [Clonorchis sinensis]|uniref:Uncharacterized protein n=1 Tax=Clonorchis sinensis TaxID=79923 RepID=A0A419QAU2_CLOSI|nr:hypothetical protein CSKR_112666 [Clonorchis sinensis]